MRYIKFTFSTNIIGTEDYAFETFSDDTDDIIIDCVAEDLARENAENYEYLVHGWNNTAEDLDMTEEEFQEEIDDYYDSVEFWWEELNEEEFEEEN